MASRNVITRLLATISILAAVSLCYAETTGNISIDDWHQRIATGIWGETIATTTTTIFTNTTTTTYAVISGGPGGGATTTTLSNASGSGITTTTARGSSSSGSTASYTRENAQKALTADQARSLVESDALLMNSIQSLAGMPASEALDYANTEEVSKNIIITKSLSIGSSSKLTITVIYIGESSVSNFIIFDKVPKIFAQSVDDLVINTNVEKSVVETDPSIAFYAPVMRKFDQIVIEYTVSHGVNPSCVNESETLVFSGATVKDNSSFLWLVVPMFILSAVVIAAMVFRNQIVDVLEGGGKKKKRRTAASSTDIRKSIRQIVQKLRNAILRKKEEPKFVYQHEDAKAGQPSQNSS